MTFANCIEFTLFQFPDSDDLQSSSDIGDTQSEREFLLNFESGSEGEELQNDNAQDKGKEELAAQVLRDIVN